MRSHDPHGVVLEEGQCTAVDESPTGVRLLLTTAPEKGQILEIHTDHFTATSFVEVCWSALLDDGGDKLYLVGCRLIRSPAQ